MLNLLRAVALGALGAAIGMGHSWYRAAHDPHGLPVHLSVKKTDGGKAADPATPTPGASDPDALGDDVSLAQTRALFEKGAADFVDARLEKEFAAGHILGAMSVSAESLPESLVAVLPNLDPKRERPVVVYCGGGECHASHMVADLLRQAGYGHVHVFTDGFPAWEGAKLPIDPAPAAAAPAATPSAPPAAAPGGAK
jgi:rhodanese-related sulfurtransferase